MKLKLLTLLLFPVLALAWEYDYSNNSPEDWRYLGTLGTAWLLMDSTPTYSAHQVTIPKCVYQYQRQTCLLHFHNFAGWELQVIPQHPDFQRAITWESGININGDFIHMPLVYYTYGNEYFAACDVVFIPNHARPGYWLMSNQEICAGNVEPPVKIVEAEPVGQCKTGQCSWNDSHIKNIVNGFIQPTQRDFDVWDSLGIDPLGAK